MKIFDKLRIPLYEIRFPTYSIADPTIPVEPISRHVKALTKNLAVCSALKQAYIQADTTQMRIDAQNPTIKRQSP